jgi:hypothetical protein
MRSHSEGELWAIAPIDEDNVITSADDNKLIHWNLKERKPKTIG